MNNLIEQIDSFIFERISKAILTEAKQNSETLEKDCNELIT